MTQAALSDGLAVLSTWMLAGCVATLLRIGGRVIHGLSFDRAWVVKAAGLSVLCLAAAIAAMALERRQ